MIAGVQVNVKPSVRTIGVQCSITLRDIGVQCSLAGSPTTSLYALTSSPIPSDSSQSEFERQEATDHDTSAYTLRDDSSS